MASQRHKLWEQGSTAAGEIHAQGMVAPGIAMQVDPSNPNVLKAGPPLYNTGLELREPPDMTGVSVPIGEPGGPLSGSSLTGAIPESIDTGGGGPVPGPDPEPGSEPSLNSINPSGAGLSDPDFTMNVNGNNFTETSLIYFNGGAENTTFISSSKLSTIVKPSLASAPIEVGVWVQQGSYQTTEKTFHFVEGTWSEPPPEGGETEPSTGRSFPIGPINLSLVEDHADGIALSLAELADVQIGDTLLVEATGNTTINGSYTVLSLDPIVVNNTVELAAPIEARGRVTVTG